MSKKTREFRKHLNWLKHRQEKIEKRRKSKKKHKRKKNIGIRFTPESVIIDFPKHIDLYNKYRCKETLDFFNQEFNNMDNYPKGIIFDFTNTRKISLSGGIIIKCLFDFLKSKKTKIIIQNTVDNKVKQILCHIGLVSDEAIQITHDDISRWQIQSWNKKETPRKKIKMDLISSIIQKTTDWGIRTKSHKRLYEVIPEILYNCIEHAYNEDDEFQWFYLFSGIADNNYVFCVLDRGMGFKATYEKRGVVSPDKIKNDGDYIRFSIEHNHSSLFKSGRGNGLPALKENILALSGHIFIHSYKGEVVIFKKNEIQSENRYPLVGSLLQFSVPKGEA
ncbi:MAG: ATP-binding protein [Dysgonamonadaceae bacterium]|jgi:hypothetical protein|nr:ATP-binding protein [Dysgonamonadaceae bacterium]